MEDKTTRQLDNYFLASGPTAPSDAALLTLNEDNTTSLGFDKKFLVSDFKTWVNSWVTHPTPPTPPAPVVDQYNIFQQALLNTDLFIDQYAGVVKPYTATTSRVYIVDRFTVQKTGTVVATVDILTAANYPNNTSGSDTVNQPRGLRVTGVTAGGASDKVTIQQIIDQGVSYSLFGEEVIYSVWVWSNTANSARLSIGGSVFSSYHTGNQNWEKLEIKRTIAEYKSDLGGGGGHISVQLLSENITATTVNDFSKPNCNAGDTRIEPTRRHNELQLCQRYAWYIQGSGAAGRLIFSGGCISSTTECSGSLYFPVEMRTAPSIITTGTNSDYTISYKAVTHVSTSQPSLFFPTTINTGIKFTASGLGGVLGEISQARLITSASVYIGFDAEV